MEFDFSLAMILAAGPIKEPLVPLWAMELMASVFLYAWLFCFGACVGSFLNVVIYRLPRGKSLVHPGSICPHCGHAIRLRDNIPILSWLALRGKCRDCRGPIAPRYLLVELAVAAIFLGVALVETKLTGSFPRRNWDATRWLISPLDTLPFWSAYALHVVLLTTLLGAALIERDGFQTPGRLFLPVVLVGVLYAAIWPMLFQHPGLARASQPGGSEGLLSGLGGWLMGLVAGAIVGELWSWSSRGTWPKFAPVALFSAVGVVLGWQDVLEVGAVGLVLFAAALVISRLGGLRGIFPLAGIVLVAALPRLLDLDMRLTVPLRWPENYDGTVAATCIVIIALCALAAGAAAPPQYGQSPDRQASEPHGTIQT